MTCVRITVFFCSNECFKNLYHLCFIFCHLFTINGITLKKKKKINSCQKVFKINFNFFAFKRNRNRVMGKCKYI